MDECCVCLSLTKIKTICNHGLCKECFKKLNKKICPICRHSIKPIKNARPLNLQKNVKCECGCKIPIKDISKHLNNGKHRLNLYELKKQHYNNLVEFSTPNLLDTKKHLESFFSEMIWMKNKIDDGLGKYEIELIWDWEYLGVDNTNTKLYNAKVIDHKKYRVINNIIFDNPV